jgi:hypothetical protein
MDLCIKNKVHEQIYIPKCSKISIGLNSYFEIEETESSFMTSLHDNQKVTRHLSSPISQHTFEGMLSENIQASLNNSFEVEKIVGRLIELADINKDEELNFGEAKALWKLINDKNTFFMLVLAGKSYMPNIRSYCGNLIEIENIQNQITIATSSYFTDVFSNWFQLDWKSRCKISLGILEFYLDAVSFNSNDEFGRDSLQLCSPIEASFGYSRFFEAKLINYEHLMTSSQLEKILSNRYCKTDDDCIYNQQCATKCDSLHTNKCQFFSQKPQIANFCSFVKQFLNDNLNFTRELNPLLDECLQLAYFNLQNETTILFSKNEMPVSYDKLKKVMARNDYWKASQRFNNVTSAIYNLLWDQVKFLKDPEKPKHKASN